MNDDLTPREELGLRLREVREAVPGLLIKHVAAAADIDAGFASRVERGERWAQPEHIRAWAQAANLDEEATQSLLDHLADARAQDANQKSRAPYGPKAAQAARTKQLVAAAKVSSFSVTEIPFFLQTDDYARHEIGDTPGAADIAALRRTAANEIGKGGKHFRVIVVESALRLLPCGTKVMQGQLAHLHSFVDRPGIDFGVIPFGRELVNPLKNGFTVYDGITVVDSYAGQVALLPKETKRYTEILRHLWDDDAVHGATVRDILDAARNALPQS